MMKNFIISSAPVLMLLLGIGFYGNSDSLSDKEVYMVFAQIPAPTTTNNSIGFDNTSNVSDSGQNPISLLPITVNKLTWIEGTGSLLQSQLTNIKRTVIGDINSAIRAIPLTPNQTIQLNAELTNEINGNKYSTNSLSAIKAITNIEITDLVRSINTELGNATNFKVVSETQVGCTVANSTAIDTINGLDRNNTRYQLQMVQR